MRAYSLLMTNRQWPSIASIPWYLIVSLVTSTAVSLVTSTAVSLVRLYHKTFHVNIADQHCDWRIFLVEIGRWAACHNIFSMFEIRMVTCTKPQMCLNIITPPHPIVQLSADTDANILQSNQTTHIWKIHLNLLFVNLPWCLVHQNLNVHRTVNSTLGLTDIQYYGNVRYVVICINVSTLQQ